jgi:hypothetical protein
LVKVLAWQHPILLPCAVKTRPPRVDVRDFRNLRGRGGPGILLFWTRTEENGIQ